MSALVGIDVGTGGSRALAVNESGEVLAEESVEYSLYSPPSGWSEQDPEDWWRAIKEVLGRVAVDVEDEIVGLGLRPAARLGVPRRRGQGHTARSLVE